MTIHTTDRVILHALVNGQSFRSTCGYYVVDFYSDFFVVSVPSLAAITSAEVFDEEEFSLAFSDTQWLPA
jgi:hypothetical protein